MENFFIVVAFGLVLAVLLAWAFRRLPGEDWQILAAMPVRKEGDSSWIGLNLTYYGVFTANAYVVALAVFFALLGSLGVDWLAILLIAVVLLGVCVPASGWIARIVEGKRHTFTVGGASFAGIVVAPWIAGFVGTFFEGSNDGGFPLWAFLAALSVAYSLGEGLGRLACISFGCCYGRRMEESHPWIQRFFRNRAFIFLGETKKAAYAGGLEGCRLVPIQAVTSVLYLLSGLIGLQLFCLSMYRTAFLTVVVVTQVWRFLSEFLRADYRGDMSVSAYQIMALLAPLYAVALLLFIPLHPISEPDLLAGVLSLWSPWKMLFLQASWMAIFVHTGRSRVTSSRLFFHVLHERV